MNPMDHSRAVAPSLPQRRTDCRMLVPSLTFLAFAAIAALIYNLGRAVWWRQVVLLVTNLAFLSSFSHDPVAFLPLAGFLALGFVSQRLVSRGARSRLFVVLLVLTSATFFWLKRYTFITSAIYLSFPYALIGLSYIFFRVMHLIIDSHQRAIEQRVTLTSYLNYTLNFTSLISGPIQRYQDYHQMETEGVSLDLVAAGTAAARIVLGYFKVAVVAMVLSLAQHQAIDGLAEAHDLGGRVWLGFQAFAIYPFYLFFNFSGYIDVVIGTARFFRIALPENFDRPFSAENVMTFWNRWHMTLSGWLKTYVFNPLLMAGMLRVTAPNLAPYVSVVAFFVTFFLVGLWHGQTSEFLFFGFLTGGGMATNKLYQVIMQNRLGRQGYRKLAANALYRACCRGLNVTWFTFTLLWFWSRWTEIGGFANALGAVAWLLTWVAVFAVTTILFAAVEIVRDSVLRLSWHGTTVVRSRYLRTAWTTALLVLTLTTTFLLDLPAPDIIYKTF
jgi:alginate O-acetyltransferase complex protein AlgI